MKTLHFLLAPLLLLVAIPLLHAQSGGSRDGDDAKRRPGDSSAGKPGSRSPGHRGYRDQSADAPAKRRWTEQERAGRDEARAIRTHSRDERGRPADSRRDAGGRSDDAAPRDAGARRTAAGRDGGRTPGARDSRGATARRDSAPGRVITARS